jgi:hypothetical protein
LPEHNKIVILSLHGSDQSSDPRFDSRRKRSPAREVGSSPEGLQVRTSVPGPLPANPTAAGYRAWIPDAAVLKLNAPEDGRLMDAAYRLNM